MKKKNFKVILIYFLFVIFIPAIVSFYLTMKSSNYFYNYKISGLTFFYKEKLELYDKISEYMYYKNDSEIPNIDSLNKLIKKGVSSYPGYKTTIFDKKFFNELHFDVILRGKKEDFDDLNFENYIYQIESGLRSFFKSEKSNLINIIEKMQILKVATVKDYKRRFGEYNREEVLGKLETEMADVVTQLETKILIPKLRLDIVTELLEHIEENQFYEYERKGGSDKTMKVYFDHLIKFFILGNIIFILINPGPLKKVYKFLSVIN